MIRVAQEGRVCRITLASPATRNVLTRESGAALCAAWHAAQGDEGIGAVLLDAEGKIFCGGSDANDPPGAEVFQLGRRAHKPTVVAIQGVAISAGVALLAGAQCVVAAQGSSFGLTDLREGRADIDMLRAVEVSLGPRRTCELALTGRIFTTPDALQWGLIHAAVPVFELEERALAVAQGLAGARAEAVAAILACYP
jgi:enoyl-CoA hydratase/carnithine racemase